MPVTDLERDTPDRRRWRWCPQAIARENLAIPLRVDDDGLHVAVAQPSDDIRLLLGGTSAGTRSGCRSLP